MPSLHTETTLCANNGCGRKARGSSKICQLCRYPAGYQHCSTCKLYAYHPAQNGQCYICRGWHNIIRRTKICGKQRALKVTLTKQQYWALMMETTVCEDSGHVFDDANDNKQTRKSPNRMDNNKGYEPGNVRVITYKANIMRGVIPLESWKLAAAHMRENNLW